MTHRQAPRTGWSDLAPRHSRRARLVSHRRDRLVHRGWHRASTGDLAWAGLLDSALSAEVSTSFASSNLAVGGYTAHDLTAGSGVPGSIDDAIAERPDLIIVALAGSNDLSPDTSTELFVLQMAALREAAREKAFRPSS
jgi:hypothetical protein